MCFWADSGFRLEELREARRSGRPEDPDPVSGPHHHTGGPDGLRLGVHVCRTGCAPGCEYGDGAVLLSAREMFVLPLFGAFRHLIASACETLAALVFD